MSEEPKKKSREEKKKQKKEKLEQLLKVEQENLKTVEGTKGNPEGTKKHRKRLKGLYKRLVEQLEFYFSDANLRKDGFMMQLIKKDPWVELAVFEKFNKMKTMMAELVKDGNSVQHHLARALEVKKSSLLEISEDGTKVKRLNKLQDKEDIEDCTIYVENIAPDASHEVVKNRFNQFGTVAYVSIPKFQKSQKAKGFAFIEFENVESVKNVMKACGLKLDDTNLPDPASLTSIKTFTEGDEAEGKENDDQVLKRKHENEDDDFDAPKRLRIDENLKKAEPVTCPGSENLATSAPAVDSIAAAEGEETPLMSLHGFRILTKTQWRRLRNKYLNQQRINVSAAKALIKIERRETRPAGKKTEAIKNESSLKLKVEAPEALAKGIRTEAPETHKPLEFTKGIILRITVPGGIDDVKKCKRRVRESEDVGYIDATIGHDIFYVRCKSEEQADKLLTTQMENWTLIKLKEQAESDYWLKIQQDMADKKSGKVVVPKEKRKKKLLATMEQSRNSHVHFGD